MNIAGWLRCINQCRKLVSHLLKEGWNTQSGNNLWLTRRKTCISNKEDPLHWQHYPFKHARFLTESTACHQIDFEGFNNLNQMKFAKKATSKANLTKMIETFFKNQETSSDKNKKLHCSFQWFRPIKVPSIIANMAIIGVFCENYWWSTAKLWRSTHNWRNKIIMPSMRTSVDKQYQH